MPDGRQIQDTLTAPLAALEELLRAPAQVLKEGVQQLNCIVSLSNRQSVQRSGLPRLPEPPEPPKVFRR
jgi:hypothetical protein